MNPRPPEILAVTYHYLTGAVFPGPGVHPFGPERFRAQVEELSRTCRFLSLADLEAGNLPKLGGAARYALLTFDDGLAEQFEVAMPVLGALGIPGAFFPCTASLGTGRLLHVHRIHALRSAMPDPELLLLFLDLAGRLELEESVRAISRGGGAAAPYPYDSPGARVLKSLFNYELPMEEREALSEAAFAEVYGPEVPWAKRLYMSPASVRKLSQAGFLGTHTHAHRPLSRLSPEAIRQEIRESLDILEKTAGTRPRSVSYPYGNSLAVSAEVFEAAAECGMECGFTTERKTNIHGADRLRLARFDAEDLPPGKRPIASL